jgi:hypothetical protein
MLPGDAYGEWYEKVFCDGQKCDVDGIPRNPEKDETRSGLFL